MRRSRWGGRGSALRDVLIGSLILGITILLVEMQMQSNAAIYRGALCQTNARQVGMALFMYAADYDGNLPASSGSFAGLVAGTRPYLRDDSRFHCPQTGVTAQDGPVAFRTPGRYAGLPAAGGWPDPYLNGRTADPAHTILLFESATDRGPEIAPSYRHSGGAVCLMFSGQSAWVQDLRPQK
jgi:hypothetical protein